MLFLSFFTLFTFPLVLKRFAGGDKAILFFVAYAIRQQTSQNRRKNRYLNLPSTYLRSRSVGRFDA